MTFALGADGDIMNYYNREPNRGLQEALPPSNSCQICILKKRITIADEERKWVGRTEVTFGAVLSARFCCGCGAVRPHPTLEMMVVGAPGMLVEVEPGHFHSQTVGYCPVSKGIS